MAVALGMPFSPGESRMHTLMRLPSQDNPTAPMLTQQLAYMLQVAPLLAIGTVDDQSRPWTTLWGGNPGFSQPLGNGIIGTRTVVDAMNDPVVQALTGGKGKGQIVRNEGKEKGRMIAGLAFDLVTRKRVKLAGRTLAAALDGIDIDPDDLPDDWDPESGVKGQAQLQLVYRIEQSLGNCPKYLNQKQIKPAVVGSKLVSEGENLSGEAVKLIAKADMFFVSSANGDVDMDCNHRGGPPGFVRVLSNTLSGAAIVYPEYSGNRLYQTLGNLQLNPRIGVTVPDYETGDVLYTTGVSEVLVGEDAKKILPGSNLAVKIKIDEARFVKQGLPFRGTSKEPSPYNPLVRTLATEGNIRSELQAGPANTAKLTSKTKLTPSIARIRFAVTNPIRYRPGQWVALDFSNELDLGYSHMRNDDPRSLNDDWIRTFTISSHPTSESEREFEITFRNVGPVTNLMFEASEKMGLEVPVRGFGGEFAIKQEAGAELIPYIAGGVGITPLLATSPMLEMERLRLLWTVRGHDIPLVLDVVGQFPGLAASTRVFITGSETGSGVEEGYTKLRKAGLRCEMRRLRKEDLEELGRKEGKEIEAWYLCAGKGLRKSILEWLPGKRLVFEDFDY